MSIGPSTNLPSARGTEGVPPHTMLTFVERGDTIGRDNVFLVRKSSRPQCLESLLLQPIFEAILVLSYVLGVAVNHFLMPNDL